MSDAKTYTEREVVDRERAAFVAGTHWQSGYSMDACAKILRDSPSDMNCPTHVWSRYHAEKQAIDLYPFPKVTRPREVPDPHDPRGKWRAYPELRSDPLFFSHPEVSDGDYYDPPDRFTRPTRERVALWADLLANPTETVEDEG